MGKGDGALVGYCKGVLRAMVCARHFWDDGVEVMRRGREEAF